MNFPGEREKGLTKTPIRATLSYTPYDLDKAARLDYAKIYTVEHNVKVFFIGKIHADSTSQFQTDYNLVHSSMLAPSLSAPVYKTLHSGMAGFFIQ